MIRGGQGRSPSSIGKDASGVVFSFLLLLALVAMLVAEAMS